MSGGTIISFGARTPLGLDAWQTSMLWRAAKLTPRRSDFRDSRGNFIGSVRARCVPDDVTGYARLVALAGPALREAHARASLPRGETPPLLLAVAEPRPGLEGLAERGILAEIAHRAGVEIDLANSHLLPVGHAGFAVAMQRALSTLGTARQHVLVGGVDTYHHPDTLAWLDQERRLHADGIDNGITPAEGAAFLVLGRGASNSPIRVDVHRVACALEEGAEQGPDPDLGKALIDVIRRCSEGTALPAPWVLTDCNGERHRVRAWSFAKIRASNVVSSSKSEFLDVGTELGDVGAATGALLAVHAAASFTSGACAHRSALIALSSEGRERGAFFLEVPT
jgi:3-oxoacyl-[acyl-carrier-protein] synthase-1